jgi:hypothetical protein
MLAILISNTLQMELEADIKTPNSEKVHGEVKEIKKEGRDFVKESFVFLKDTLIM